MITAVNEKTYDLRGLSSDEKPYGPNVSNWDKTTVIRIANGSTLFLMDTCEVYVYSITGESVDEDGNVTPGVGEWILVE